MQSAFGFLLGDDDDPPRAWLAALLSNAQLATLLSLSFLPHRTQLITNAKPTLTQPKQVTMESIQKSVNNAATYVSESLSGASATAQKEGNKEQAKNSNAGVGERLSAAGSAVSAKADETSSEAKKENAKQNI